MDLLPFTDVQMDSEESRREFLDLNALTHETVFQTLLGLGIITDHYPLFTMAGSVQDWLETHGAEHTAWASALGLPTPPDLVTVDLNDPSQAEDWLNNHALAHNLIALTLGL